MERYPVNGKPGPEAGWPKTRKGGNRKSVNTNMVKAGIKKIEALIKQAKVTA
jgi:hypothetical protein